MGIFGGGDEDAIDRYLDNLGKAAKSTYCQKPFKDKETGKMRKCTKKKGHWGGHK